MFSIVFALSWQRIWIHTAEQSGCMHALTVRAQGPLSVFHLCFMSNSHLCRAVNWMLALEFAGVRLSRRSRCSYRDSSFDFPLKESYSREENQKTLEMCRSAKLCV